MRIVSIFTVYNEEDIIVPALRDLIDQGTFVYVIDNWSKDRTGSLAAELVGRGVLGVEKFPADGPQPSFSWRDALLHIEQLTRQLEADWFLLCSPDEVHRSPWRGTSLKDGISQVDAEGYNCIDHAVMTFSPVDDSYQPGTSLEEHFRFYEWSDIPGHFNVANGWKNAGEAVSLAASGGHEARFENRRIYPYKFLLKHYPIRSQAHGTRKVLQERLSRWDAEERAQGWHTQYDGIEEGHAFLRRAADLTPWSDADFPITMASEGRELIDWGGMALAAVLTREGRSND